MGERGSTTIPADTSPEAARVQAEILAGMRPDERMRIAFELSEGARRMARAGLRHRNPGLSDEELVSRLVELCYGVELPG